MITMYITDSNANLLLVGSGGSGSNITINSPDNSILITGNGQSFQLQVSETIQAAVEASIKAGDNISLLNNDSNYITLADVVTPGLQAVTDVLNTTTNAIVIETTPGTGFSYTSGGVFGAEDSTFQVGAAKLRVYGTAEISGTVTLNDGLRGAEADKKLSIRTNTLSEDSERFLADNVFGREVLSVNGIPADTDGNITITGDTGFIPITGTENSNPVTGDILLQYDGYSNRLFSNYIIIQDTDNIESSTLDNKTLLFSNSSTGKNLIIDNEFGISTDSNSIGIKTDGAVSSGLYYDANYFPNTTDRSILDKEGVQTLINNNSIPLSGTTENTPITGDLEIQDNNNLKIFAKAGDVEKRLVFTDEGIVVLEQFDNSLNTSTAKVEVSTGQVNLSGRDGNTINVTDFIVGSTGVNIDAFNPDSRGISSSIDYTSNITDLDYTQKKYVDETIAANTPVGTEGTIPVWQSGILSTIPNEIKFDTTNRRFDIGTQDALTPGANSNYKFKLGTSTAFSTDFFATLLVSDLRTTSSNFNSIDSEARATLSTNTTNRVRGGKFVSLVNMNGFSSTNSGGGGEGIEGVTRITGTGSIDVITGAYFRTISDINDPLSIVKNAHGIIVPEHSGALLSPFQIATGIVLCEQGVTTRSTNTANLAIGAPSASVGNLTGLFTGKYNIWSPSTFKSYFEGSIGIGINSPTEKLDVVGNIRATGTVNSGGLTIPTGTLTITSGSASNLLRGDGSIATISNTIQNQVISGYVTGTNTPVTSASTVRTAVQDLQAQITALTPLTATATLDFPSTNGATSSDLTVALTGASLGDVVLLGTPDQPANSTFTAFVSAANVVTVRYNNYSSLAINPPSGVFKIKIIK